MFLSVLSLALSGIGVSSAASYGTWGITDLGSLSGGGDTSYAFAINANGEVTGYSGTAPYTHGFTYSGNGPMVDLGLEATAPSTGNTIMYAINDSGKVAGRGTTSDGARALYGVPFANLGLMPGNGYGTSIGYAINASGEVAGYSYVGSSTSFTIHAFVTDVAGGTMYDLGLLPGTSYTNSYAKGINANYVVGYGSDNISSSLEHAGVWQFSIAGGALTKSVTDIHSALLLSGEENSSAIGSEALAINGNNQVVGKVVKTISGTVSYAHAFLYTIGGAVVKDIGHLSGDNCTEALGLNNSGQIVGTDYSSANTAAKRAFYYDGSAMRDLNSSTAVVNLDGWVLKSAQGINDHGQIVGWGINSAGKTHAFLLNPTLPGDANLDGKVDVNDLTKVLTNYGQTTGMGWTLGDFNGDAAVDVNDLTIVLSHYSQTAGSSAADVAAVPEPASLAMLAAALAAAVWAITRRRK
jgi:probable HAF family extracellular repeat protein